VVYSYRSHFNLTLPHYEKYCSENSILFGKIVSFGSCLWLSLDVMVDGSDVLALEGLSLAIVVEYLGIFP
jgi:hypothetical protein